MSAKEDKNDKKEKSYLSKRETSILSEEEPQEEKKKVKIVKSPEVEPLIQKGKVQEVLTKARFLKISPKKVRLVIDVIRGMKVKEAVERLQFIKKKAAILVIKLLNSALSNAENNFKLNKEDLYIKKIFANEGPSLHRWQPRAYGRAAPIRKRTTHLVVILGIKEEIPEKKKMIKIKKQLTKVSKKSVKRLRKEKEIIPPKEQKRKERAESIL
jgi:large subunit ribosomal protein L22